MDRVWYSRFDCNCFHDCSSKKVSSFKFQVSAFMFLAFKLREKSNLVLETWNLKLGAQLADIAISVRTPICASVASTRAGSPRSLQPTSPTRMTARSLGRSANTSCEKFESGILRYKSHIALRSKAPPNIGTVRAKARNNSGNASRVIFSNASTRPTITKLFHRQP